MKDILLPVAHVFALVMMVFAATMLAPLVMAIWGGDALPSSHIIRQRILKGRRRKRPVYKLSTVAY